MWTVVATICFMGMALSPEKPLCFQQARTPLQVESEASCILIRDQLVKDLNTDLNARNINMSLYCAKIKQTTDASYEQIKS
jgi:hypothetical protein